VIKDANSITLYVTQQIENPDTHEMEDMEFQVFNPTHEMLINDGWELYTIPEPTEEEIFNKTKREKINEINHYDSSGEVNIFYIQGLPVWLDKATRAGLKLRFEAELAMKEENTTLWYGNQNFTLQLNMAIQMLYAIEVYASKCYDNTQKHLANVEKLETLEEIMEYDYKAGYPEKLNF
jgi:hypothetical protein